MKNNKNGTKKISYYREGDNRTKLSGIALLNANNGCSRQRLAGSQYGFNVYICQMAPTCTFQEFEGIREVHGLIVCKIVLLGVGGGGICSNFFRHFCCRMYCLGTYTTSQADKETNRQTNR